MRTRKTMEELKLGFYLHYNRLVIEGKTQDQIAKYFGVGRNTLIDWIWTNEKIEAFKHPVYFGSPTKTWESEDEIRQSLDMTYNVSELQGWELEQFNKATE